MSTSFYGVTEAPYKRIMLKLLSRIFYFSGKFERILYHSVKQMGCWQTARANFFIKEHCNWIWFSFETTAGIRGRLSFGNGTLVASSHPSESVELEQQQEINNKLAHCNFNAFIFHLSHFIIQYFMLEYNDFNSKLVTQSVNSKWLNAYRTSYIGLN